jgi:hypothetical protein
MSDYACFDFNFLMHKFPFLSLWKFALAIYQNGSKSVGDGRICYLLYAVILFNWLEIRQSFWQVNGYKWFFIVGIIIGLCLWSSFVGYCTLKRYLNINIILGCSAWMLLLSSFMTIIKSENIRFLNVNILELRLQSNDLSHSN